METGDEREKVMSTFSEGSPILDCWPFLLEARVDLASQPSYSPPLEVVARKRARKWNTKQREKS
jgi:hypothetical protein